MTKDDLWSLSGSKLYKFHLYYGDYKYGYIHEDHSSNKYYIVRPTAQNRDEPLDKKGFPIRLDQIDSWEEITPNPIQQGSSFTIKNNPNSKKAIIFGAGASYDYTYENVDISRRMPLTKHLFSSLYDNTLQKYPGAFDLSSEISLSNDLEHYFQSQWEKIEQTHNAPLLNKLVNAQYYIHDLFNNLSDQFSNSNRSNYLNLMKLAHEYTMRHENEHVPIISFNYDTLIEEAIQRTINSGFETLDHYIDFENRKLILFKPHGSCNWIKEFKFGLIDINYIRKNKNDATAVSSLIYNSGFNLAMLNKFISDKIKIRDVSDNKNDLKYNYFPWILIPYKNKDGLIMPDNHTTMLKHYLPKVEELLIIGWKGTEANFQEMLKNSIGNRKVKITLIEPDKDAIENFKKEYSAILPNAEFSTKFSEKEDGSTFSDYIKHCQNSPHNFFS